MIHRAVRFGASRSTLRVMPMSFKTNLHSCVLTIRMPICSLRLPADRGVNTDFYSLVNPCPMPRVYRRFLGAYS
jgi:hypothetical protein